MGGKASVLIAEDDDLTRELLVKVLRRDGYNVVEAVDGQDALEKLRAGQVDLVLSDIQMAQISGMELLDAIQKRAPEIPVVLITAYAEPGAAMDAIMRRHLAWVEKGRGDGPPNRAGFTALGETYLEHPDFRATYERVQPGLTQYMADAMRAFADRELV